MKIKIRHLLAGGALCAALIINPLPGKLQQDIKVEVNGQNLAFDVWPIMENDRVLVPVRAIFEALEATVDWEQSQKLVTAQKDADTVKLQIGNYLMQQNGKPVILDAAPRLLNDRTLVPIRAVSESFGAKVTWEQEQAKVVVTTDPADVPSQPETPENPETPDTPESDFEQEVLRLVNQERAKQNLSPLAWHDGLAQVARAHSKDMNDRRYMAHNNPDGQTPFDRIKNHGISYRAAAENIAAGQRTPAQVMQGWMNSSGHRQNILNPNLTKLGVGYYEGDGPYKTYWTQCFIAD